MIGKIIKFTNEGAIVNVKGDDFTLLRGTFKNVDLGDEIEVEIADKNAGTVVPVDFLPHEGELRFYRVCDKTKFGYFLDINMPSDLFVPFAHSYPNVKKGDMVAVAIKRDREGRLYGSMKVAEALSPDHEYKENDHVSGTVYSIKKGLGVFVAVDNKYDSLIRQREVTRAYEIGDHIEARVAEVLPDGKMTLSFRERAHLQIDQDSVIIMEELLKHPDLPVGDKSSPEEIYERFGLSKQAFKRAIGRLKKQGLIKIGPHNIRRIED